MIRVVYIVAGSSGFGGKRVVRKFFLNVLYARLVVDDDWADVED